MNFWRETNIKITIVLGIIFSLSFAVFSAKAETVDELKTQKNQLQEKINALNSQIKNLQGQISETRQQAASLKNEIFIYDAQIQSTELQIQAHETQIQDTNLQITELERQIERRVKEIEENKTILKELIVELYQMQDSQFLQLIGNKNFSDFLDQLEYTTTVQDKVYQIVQNIKEVKAKLETQQSELKAELKKLEDLKAELEITQASLEQQRGHKQRLLDQTRGVEGNYQRLLSATKNEEDKLQKEIEDLDASIRAKLGNKTIAPASGALAKPMDGIITQRYGNTGFTSLGYSFHNGLDIAAPAGKPIYAAANGTVTACGTGEAAYGNWCTIKHNIASKNGTSCIVTLYAHMRSFKVKAGQQVSQGDLVGYEGNTGNTTRLLYGPERGYHLHFTVFDCEGFGIADGQHSKVYGPYKVPYGYTYNPANFF